MQDVWLSCVAYYLQKGQRLDYLLNLSEDAKTFFIASMELSAELENQKIQTIFGSMLGG